MEYYWLCSGRVLGDDGSRNVSLHAIRFPSSFLSTFWFPTGPQSAREQTRTHLYTRQTGFYTTLHWRRWHARYTEEDFDFFSRNTQVLHFGQTLWCSIELSWLKWKCRHFDEFVPGYTISCKSLGVPSDDKFDNVTTISAPMHGWIDVGEIFRTSHWMYFVYLLTHILWII